jgi:serine/threonine protein kinase/LysM repeat protein
MAMLTQKRTDLSGQQIGNYELNELLIHRAVSDFYIGHDVKLGQPVYIEILKTTVDQDPSLTTQFQRRTETVSQLKNPYIAPVIDVGVTEEGYQFAILEFISGDWLDNKLAYWREEGNTLSVNEALLLARQIAEAISVAHSAGLVDPDLRPENILIRETDKTPVIFDLGVPLTVTSRDSVLTNGPATALDYASPEEIEGKSIGRRSNIYSLGIILYELLTGHRPKLPTSSWDIFERSTMPKEVPLEEERQGLSGETYRLVRNCLWRQEWSRFESADELISAIDTAILAEQSLPKATIWTSRRRRWLYIAVPIVALLFIVFGLVLVWSQFANAQQGQGGSPPTTVSEPAREDPNSVAAVNLETPAATATFTREAPPTSAAETTIPVFGPPAEQAFSDQEIIGFAWIWLTLPRENEIFAVYLFAEDDGGEAVLVGTVEEPDNASLYLLEKSPAEIGIGPGSYLWQVRLEEVSSGNMVVESNPRRLTILEESTATPTQTPTSTPSPTATELPPTATPTEVACEPSAPPGWFLHSVQAGETPSFFAQRANVPVEQIFDANCLFRGAVLSVGQQLFIPPPLVTNTPTPGPATQPPPQPTDDTGGGSGGGGGGGSQPTEEPTEPPDPPTSTPPPPPPAS